MGAWIKNTMVIGAMPRFRSTLVAPFTIDNAWKRLDFSADNPRNANTFVPSSKDFDTRDLRYDADKKLFMYNINVDNNYLYEISLDITTGLKDLEFEYRFYVPSTPDPNIFPLPDTLKSSGFGAIRALTTKGMTFQQTHYVTELGRKYGVGIDIRVATPNVILSSQATVNAGTVIITPSSGA